MNIHLKEKPFKCKYCSYSSSQQGNVQNHARRKHPYVSNVKVPVTERKSKLEGKPLLPKESKCVKSFKCDQCSASFVREDSLKCHVKQHSDSSLSTAYAVLKLQQPVINTSRSAESVHADSQDSQVVSDAVNTHVNLPNQKEYSAPSQGHIVTSIATKEQGTGTVSNTQVLTPEGQGQSPLNSGQGQIGMTSPVFQGQQVSLGINDILLAAGMAGHNSVSTSPISSKELPRQSLTSGLRSNTVICTSPSQDGILNNGVIGQSPQDVPSVQVMQNISLPYIRLPNGQVLILTGQTSLNQIPGNQTGQAVLTDGAHTVTAAEIRSQLLVQQSEMPQNQIVQCAADSTTSTDTSSLHGLASQSSENLSSQQGAIPIQIILPSDSQQALPLVSQLLNSVVNKNPEEAGNQTQPALQTSSQATGGQTVQNFVLQIPSQVGSLKDAAGNVAESQSYVLQIPGTNFN